MPEGLLGALNRKRICNGFENVLFDTLLQGLKRATNGPTITVPRNLGDNIAQLCEDRSFLLELSGRKTNTWLHSKIAIFDCCGDLFFEFSSIERGGTLNVFCLVDLIGV